MANSLETMSTDLRTHRARRALLTVLAILVAGAVGWWAGRVALAPTPAPLASASGKPLWATASEGSVGRALQYSVTLRQPVVPVAYNALAGVVTQANPGEIGLGDVLYQVGDVPVRAVDSQSPYWRDLARGMSGEDVAGLHRLLSKLGQLSGPTDDDFDARTELAVQAWQKAEGRSQTGVVTLGELTALPRLPVTVSLGAAITTGAVLVGGEEAVRAPTGAREFVLVLSQDQARQVPDEAPVNVHHEDLSWPAVITGQSQDESGQVVFALAGPAGREVCGDDCGALPLDEQVTLRAEVIVSPEVSGVTVPVAAVRTSPSGEAFVVAQSGQVPVRVLGSGRGVAVVEGLEAGTQVQLGTGTGNNSPAPAASASLSPGLGASATPSEEG